MIFGLVEFELNLRVVRLVLPNHGAALLQPMEGAKDSELVAIDLVTIRQVFGDAHG